MYEDEFKLAVTHTVALHHNQVNNTYDVAILWEGDTLEKIQIAPKVNAAQTHLALPIVRLLRNRGKQLPNGCVISTTAQPTEACLGMARMCHVHYVLFLAPNGDIQRVTCERADTKWGFWRPDVKGKGPIPNVVRKVGHETLNVPWSTNPVGYKADLPPWSQSFKGKSSAEAKALEAARTIKLDLALDQTAWSQFGQSGLEYLGLKALLADQTVVDNVLMMMAFEMVAQVSGFSTSSKGVVSAAAGQRRDGYSGQNIGSLMSDADGNIVSWGFNTNKHNKTRHGEVNLITNYMDWSDNQPLPNGGAIYTTLEPCEMCSGMIARTVKAGNTFRVVYGQKDQNVYNTALQRKVNKGITMEESKAALVTDKMIKSGTAVGAKNKLVNAVQNQQQTQVAQNSDMKATTTFLKEKSTYEKFFKVARPNWWLYLWDQVTSRFSREYGGESKVDPSAEAKRLNAELDWIYRLFEEFLTKVRAQAAQG